MNGRLAFAARLLLTTVAAAAWLAISNHCVIAAGTFAKQNQVTAAHSNCPGHPAPAAPGDDRKPVMIECCKTLTATSAGLERYQIGYQPGDFVLFRFRPARLCEAPTQRAALILPLDTGPPGAGSFAEIVLQQSLLAHAPPHAA